LSTKVTKRELCRAVAEDLEISLCSASMVVQSFLDALEETLLTGRRVEIRGLGSFRVAATRKTRRRIPDTGNLVAVPSRRAIRFKVAGSLVLRAQNKRSKDARVVSSQQ
jgi:nucleoid DNA-binding protein